MASFPRFSTRAPRRQAGKINIRSEVMDENYEPTPGLYAAGMECDGFSGETYGIIVPGSDECCFFSRAMCK